MASEQHTIAGGIENSGAGDKAVLKKYDHEKNKSALLEVTLGKSTEFRTKHDVIMMNVERREERHTKQLSSPHFLEAAPALFAAQQFSTQRNSKKKKLRREEITECKCMQTFPSRKYHISKGEKKSPARQF